jgi:c-di-AMP phosphodiesterase-like protein
MRIKYKQKVLELEAVLKSKEQMIDALMAQKFQMLQNIKELQSDKQTLITQLHGTKVEQALQGFINPALVGFGDGGRMSEPGENG